MTDYLDPNDIVVLPDRQRKEADPSDLIESIRRWGIINPIVVDSEKVLIAGERRLRAALELGLDIVPIRYLEDLDPIERQVLELEENLSRKDLPWQDEMRAVQRIWELKGKPKLEELAEYLGKTISWVSRRLKAAEVVKKDPSLLNAPSAANAVNKANRKEKRKMLADIGNELVLAKDEAKSVKASVEVICGDFTEWASNATEQFNFIHVDFPYGVGLDKSGIKAEFDTKVYEDTEEVYLKLMDAFFTYVDNFAAPACHVMWWLSNKFHDETVAAFESAGFTVWRDPLIWCYGGNTGIAAYPDMFPRHSYETALLAVRGDRPLVTCRWDSYVLNPQTTGRVHPSEKPAEMLEHFFRMFVDETSLVLDPTCGSGNALLAARDLGAKRVLGIELDEKYADLAKELVK